MKFYTIGRDQGQIVEISYAYDSRGGAYKRVHDRSDRTTDYYYGDLDWDREPEGVDPDREPCVDAWVPCGAPREES